METPEKPTTAAEIFKEFFSEEKLVKLSNGMKFLIKKLDMHEIMTSGPLSLPVVKVEKEADINKLSEKDQDALRESAQLVLRRILLEGCLSPKFVDGKSDPDKNEIGLDDSRFPSGLKTELQGHIYDFNGYAETAREFFRLVSPGKLVDAGPPGAPVSQSTESAAQS